MFKCSTAIEISELAGLFQIIEVYIVHSVYSL